MLSSTPKLSYFVCVSRTECLDSPPLEQAKRVFDTRACQCTWTTEFHFLDSHMRVVHKCEVVIETRFLAGVSDGCVNECNVSERAYTASASNHRNCRIIVCSMQLIRIQNGRRLTVTFGPELLKGEHNTIQSGIFTGKVINQHNAPYGARASSFTTPE